MDERILFQTIECAIRDAMRDGFDWLMAEQPTLRDRFAMAALQGLVAGRVVNSSILADTDCEVAYLYADAMLRARQPGAEQEGGRDE